MDGKGETRTFSLLLDLVAEEQGAWVSFLDIAGVCAQVPALALRANQGLHSHPYCLYAKSQGGLAACVANRSRSVKRAKRQISPFSGSCPHGLWDLAWPVRDGKDLLGILYLGGFRADKAPAKLGRAAYSGAPLLHLDSDRRRALESRAAFLAGFLSLALWKWKKAGRRLQKQRGPGEHLRAVEHSIRTRYGERLTLAALARELGVHPVYLGSLIHARTGKGFKELLLNQRLALAQLELKRGAQTVTSIAHETGFGDSNYFSRVFHRAFGLSPREFRRRQGAAPQAKARPS